MDYLAAIGKAAALPAKLAWRLITLGEEDFEYESRTSLPPEPRMPEFRTTGPAVVKRLGVVIPHESDASLVISMPLHSARDSSNPEEFRYVVANAAAEAYDELRRRLRQRRD